jgi:hypothetical protein
MPEYIVATCKYCGGLRKTLPGECFRCTACTRTNVWVEEEHTENDFVEEEVELDVEEEVLDEETYNDIGDIYDEEEEI